MELRHLRYFVAVAEELSFSAAARRLHVAQPPLSVQVKQLEEELGTRLFERTSRRVRLTPAGELFLARATTILREAATAVREVQRAGRGELGSLRLSFSGTTLTYDPLLPEVLRRYRAAHPEVNLTLHEQRAGQQIEDLRAGRMDAGFLGLARTDTAANARGGELAVEVLLREALFAVLPDGHPLAKRRRVTRRQLQGEALVWTGRQGVFLREGGSTCARARKWTARPRSSTTSRQGSASRSCPRSLRASRCRACALCPTPAHRRFATGWPGGGGRKASNRWLASWPTRARSRASAGGEPRQPEVAPTAASLHRLRTAAR